MITKEILDTLLNNINKTNSSNGITLKGYRLLKKLGVSFGKANKILFNWKKWRAHKTYLYPRSIIKEESNKIHSLKYKIKTRLIQCLTLYRHCNIEIRLTTNEEMFLNTCDKVWFGKFTQNQQDILLTVNQEFIKYFKLLDLRLPLTSIKKLTDTVYKIKYLKGDWAKLEEKKGYLVNGEIKDDLPNFFAWINYIRE